MNLKNLLLAAKAAATVLLLTAPAASVTRIEIDHRGREAPVRLEHLEVMFIDRLTRCWCGQQLLP